MIVYLGIITFIIILSLDLNDQNTEVVLKTKQISNKSKYKVILFLISFTLIFFAGVRYNVGADYMQYASNFPKYCIQKLVFNGEPGIRIVARLASRIYNNYQMMFFLMSVITVGLCTKTIKNHSPFLIISILLYIFLGSWHESFNSVRQSAAAAIIFYGHRFIKERKLLNWIIICIFAFMFHTSAIIMFPLYFIPYKKITIKKILVLIILGIVFGFSYDRAWDIISTIQGKEYILDNYSINHISIYRIIVSWAPIIFYMLFFYKRQKKTEDCYEMNFYASMSALSAAIISAARYSTYLGRIAIYTDIFNCLFWAHMFSHFSKKDKSSRIIIIIIMGFYFLYYLSEATGKYLVNYHWIF